MELNTAAIPSVASLLFWIESRSEEPLGVEHVSYLVRRALAISLPTTAADALARARGYGDLDAAAAWEQFEFLRARAAAQGVAMADAFAAPRAQLAADLDALRRILPEVDPQDLPSPGEPPQELTSEHVEQLVASYEPYALRYIERFESGFERELPLGEILLGFVDIEADDFSPLESSAHMLAWLGERPFELVHQRLEAGFQEQDPGCTLASIRCAGEPYYLTGLREDGPDAILTRAGIACRATLGFVSSDGQPQEIDAVLMIVGVGLDADPRVSVGSDHPEAWDDIRAALTARLYELDA